MSATVTDNFPAECATVSWTCTGASGGTCTASGTGNIGDAAVLPAGASVAYSAICNIDAMATGTLANTATVSSATSDPDSANNSATDTDSLTVNPDDVIFIDGFDARHPVSNSTPSNAPADVPWAAETVVEEGRDWLPSFFLAFFPQQRSQRTAELSLTRMALT